MSKTIKKVTLFAVTLTLLIGSLVQPIGAYTSTTGTYDAQGYEEAFRQFPYVDGETYANIDPNAYDAYFGAEKTGEAASNQAHSVSRGVFAAMRASKLNLLLEDASAVSSVGNFDIFVWDGETEEWAQVTNNNKGEAVNADIMGVLYQNNAEFTGKYKAYFGQAAQLACAADTTATTIGKNFPYKYSLLNTCTPFVVRWSFSYTDNDGSADKIRKCLYYGFPTPEGGNDFADDATSYDRKCLPYRLGANLPELAMKRGDITATQDWHWYISNMTEEHEKEIADMNAAHEEALEEAKKNAYSEGYSEGQLDGGGGLPGIDTSTPTNSVLSFFAVLFKGVRDFAQPILGVELFGISVLQGVGMLCVIAVCIAMAALVVKIVKG